MLEPSANCTAALDTIYSGHAAMTGAACSAACLAHDIVHNGEAPRRCCDLPNHCVTDYDDFQGACCPATSGCYSQVGPPTSSQLVVVCMTKQIVLAQAVTCMTSAAAARRGI